MALYTPTFGDDAAPTPGSSSSSIWTPGLVVAAIALGAVYFLSGSRRQARREERRRSVQGAAYRTRRERRLRQSGDVF